MHSFRKGRIISEEAYQDWRNHKCNEDQVEKMDMLNKYYTDSILSEQSNLEQNIESTDSDLANAVDSDAVDGSGKNMSAEKSDDSFVNGSLAGSNVADGCKSNQSNSNGLSSNGSSEEGNVQPSTLAPPPTPITSNNDSMVYNCTPDTSSKTVTADRQNPIKPFKCGIVPCVKSFTTKYNLKRHQEKHHGVIRNNSRSKIVKRKGKFVRTMPRYKGRNPKLIEINGSPLADSDSAGSANASNALNDMHAKEEELPPLPGDYDDDDELGDPIRIPTQFNFTKRKPKANLTPQVLGARMLRKRKNFNEEDEDEINTEKYSRGSGNRFFYSWD